MSHGESKVEKHSITDTDYSSGDNNKMKSKSQYREENNNDIDELSKDLSEMGCIVGAVKRPPNICVETCVYEESGSENGDPTSNRENEEDAYSDSFEEDHSEVDETKEIKTSKSNDDDMGRRASTIKLSKSQSFASSKDRFRSVSGQSSFGSVSVPRTRRINMSFSNDRLREIERHNHILLRKILSARNSKSSIPPPAPGAPGASGAAGAEPRRRPIPAPATTLRKRQQRQIDHDNMILLRKIQGAKSSSLSIRR